jgi:ferredoxin
MTLIPVIDPGACSLHGDCADLAPDVFDVSGDLAVVAGTGPDEAILAAARACPAGAITVLDAAGAQVYP